jgi:uncharacterized membrane protein
LNFLFAKSSVLEWIVGSDPDKVGTPKLQWVNLPESWGVFVLLAILAAVAYGVFWLYRREISTCPGGIKLLLGGIRLAVLLLLIAMFLKPSVYFQQVNEIKPNIGLLRDGSLSLARGDLYRSEDQSKKLATLTGLDNELIGTGTVTRSELINQAFDKHPEILRSIREKGSVRIVDFADGSTPVELISALSKEDIEQAQNEKESTDDKKVAAETKMPELIPSGSGTDIWQGIRQLLDDNARPASIIVISEGQHNGSEDPLEMAQKAADLDIPIFTIGVGDPNPPKNLAVAEVYVRNKAYPDEPFEIETVLQTSRRDETGLPGKLDVKLIEQRVDESSGKLSSRTEIKTQSVNVPENGGRIRVDFDHVTNVPGKYIYTIKVDPLEDETDTLDNEMASAAMEVIDEKVKVLLISGLPNWDYHHLYKLLQRDQSIELSCWLQSMDESRPQEGNDPISRLPRTIEELGRYNVVVMIDPNPEEFDDRWIDLLKDFCKFKAGGVLYMAGPHFSSEFITLNRLKGFHEILPVRFGNTEFIDVNQALAEAGESRPERMLFVNHNMDHPVMSFRNEPEENLKIWSMMKEIYWSFPALTAKPTARVLIEKGQEQVSASGNQPLLVSGRFGAGSVLYFGFEGTWLTRSMGLQAQFFDRFWVQVVRYLVETRSLQGSRRGFIDREKSEYELGDRVTLVARLLDEQFKPLSQPAVEATVKSSDGREQTITMKMLPNQEGRYQGSFPANRMGQYDATIDLGASEEKLIDPVSFRIVAPSAESSSYWLNEKLLTDIAERTGGKYLRLDSIEQLPAQLPTMVQRAEFNSPPEPLWDISPFIRWTVFALPVILLTIEWALRKWYKLL